MNCFIYQRRWYEEGMAVQGIGSNLINIFVISYGRPRESHNLLSCLFVCLFSAWDVWLNHLYSLFGIISRDYNHPRSICQNCIGVCPLGR